MRRIVASEFLTLDGVMELVGGWNLPYFDDEMGRAMGESFASSDAILIGRVLYEEWSVYWPQQDSEENPIAGFMNGTRKYVVSTTLEGPLGWNNSQIISDDVAEEIRVLKQQDGQDIMVSGSGTLVRSLIFSHLLDELRLFIHPVVVGKGKRLFEEAEGQTSLELIGSEAFGSGVVSMTYRPQ